MNKSLRFSIVAVLACLLWGMPANADFIPYTNVVTGPAGSPGTANMVPVQGESGMYPFAVAESGTWDSILWDGTNTVGVSPGSGSQTNFDGLEIAPTFQSYGFTSPSAGNGTSYDVGGYASVRLQWAVAYTGATSIGFQCSNDNATWVSNPLFNTGNSTVAGGSSMTAVGMEYGNLAGRYFRIVYNGVETSGSDTGTIVFSTLPTIPNAQGVSASESGSWTQQPIAGTTGGATPFWLQNLGAVQSVKTSAGTLYALTVGNFSGATAYVDVFNTATGSVTLGTTAPVFEVPVAASSTVTVPVGDVGVSLSTAISVASVTASKGATGSASGVIVSGSFK